MTLTYTGGNMIFSDDGGATWADESQYLYFEQYGESTTPVSPTDVYTSGYLVRFHKRQIVGYFSTSGDLRSVEVTASGQLKTDTGIVQISGQTVTVASGTRVIVQSGVYIASGLLITSISGNAVSISGNLISISGNIVGAPATIIRTGRTSLVHSESGGINLCVLNSGHWNSGTVHDVTIKNLNSGHIYVGGTDSRPCSGYGYQLRESQEIKLDIGNPGEAYVFAAISGTPISFIGTDY